MTNFTYYAWNVDSASAYLNEYRRNNVCTRYNNLTRKQLLNDVPRIMTSSQADRYAYATLVINSNDVSQSVKNAQIQVIDQLRKEDYLPACNEYGRFAELGIGYIKNENNARLWYEYCHNKGFAIGTYNYARCLIEGIGGPTNIQLGQQLMLEATYKEYGKAMGYIAKSYIKGINGYPQDYAMAFKWYSKAASDLDTNHTYNLAYLYFKGLGCQKDMKKAALWFSMAARYDDIDAKIQYGKMCHHGDGVPVNYNESFKNFLEAANAGNAYAMHLLAFNYRFGLGCEKSTQQAIYWLNKAIQNGEEEARKTLDMIQNNK